MGCSLNFVAADFFRIVLRHDPARPGGRRGVESQKIRPGFMQLEAHVMRRDDLDRLDLFFQIRMPRPLVALEAEFYILGGEGVTVMKLHPLSQLKVVRQAVRALAPLGGEAGGHGIVGHGFHQRIVHGVHKHIGRDDARGLGRIKPGGRNVHMDRPRSSGRWVRLSGAMATCRCGQPCHVTSPS